MPLHPIITPVGTGRSALVDLARVPWSDLAFAYEHLERPGLPFDVEASLRGLGDDSWFAAVDALYSNIFHQKTVYEATAYAVPFLAAVAAGEDIPPALRLQLVILMTDIALSSSFTTDDGGFAGAFGDGVDELIRGALIGCGRFYEAIGRIESTVADAFPAIVSLATEPSKQRFSAVLAINERLASERSDEPEERPSVTSPTERYSHPTLGNAVLVRRQENGLLLRFEDGTERVILERFVTPIR